MPISKSLEDKLAHLVRHIIAVETGVHTKDTMGIAHLLDDRELCDWLDVMRRECRGHSGPIINHDVKHNWRS